MVVLLAIPDGGGMLLVLLGVDIGFFLRQLLSVPNDWLAGYTRTQTVARGHCRTQP